MKRSLLLLSAVFCGNVLAQDREFKSDFVRQQSEEPSRFAQQAPPPNPFGSPAGQGGRVQGAPPNPPGGPLPPRDPNVIPPTGGGGGGGTGSVGAFSHRLAGVVQRAPDAGGPGVPHFGEPAKRTLLVGFAKLDPAERQGLQEDIQIMSRILDKATERALESTQERRMGIFVTALPGARGDNIFIEDYGPVFILNTPIPLSGSKNIDKEKEEKANSDWEQTKRELYQNHPSGVFQPMKYDAEKVETLKQQLLEALKNGTNIRQLKPDQMITVIVTGSEHTRAVYNKKIVQKRDGEPAKEEKRHEVFETKLPTPQQTTLTIRVKKSDVDAFASGKIKAEEFAKKAMISTQ